MRIRIMTVLIPLLLSGSSRLDTCVWTDRQLGFTSARLLTSRRSFTLYQSVYFLLCTQYSQASHFGLCTTYRLCLSFHRVDTSDARWCVYYVIQVVLHFYSCIYLIYGSCPSPYYCGLAGFHGFITCEISSKETPICRCTANIEFLPVLVHWQDLRFFSIQVHQSRRDRPRRKDETTLAGRFYPRLSHFPPRRGSGFGHYRRCRLIHAVGSDGISFLSCAYIQNRQRTPAYRITNQL